MTRIRTIATPRSAVFVASDRVTIRVDTTILNLKTAFWTSEFLARITNGNTYA